MSEQAEMVVWNHDTFVDVWPTHFWCAGVLKPTALARYKLGDTVQMKHHASGPVQVVRLHVTQYRWAPPEVIYHLSNDRCASDWQVF
jgi:hypothetical protein